MAIAERPTAQWAEAQSSSFTSDVERLFERFLSTTPRFTVRVRHYRRTLELPNTYLPAGIVRKYHYEPLPTGGATCALVLDSSGQVLVERWAVCSDRDNFCRRIGHDIAVGRAFKDLRSYAE